MNPEIIDKIVTAINTSLPDYNDDAVDFSDSRYKPEILTKENFHEIKTEECSNAIVFIDGGNSEILKAPNFSLHFVRVASTTYKDNKKINSEKKECYVLATTIKEDNKIEYIAEIFPLTGTFNLKKEHLTFDSMDQSLTQKNKRASISKIGGIVRRFLEISEATGITQKLDNGDVIVLDGTLQSSVTNESDVLSELYKKAVECNVTITALSKTTTVLTQKGNSVSAVLSNICPDGKWYYFPVAEINNPDHKVNLYFTKLHERSKYLFRFEVFKESIYSIDKIMNLLARNSTDPVFIGYPYGLIEADRFARVQNRENDYIKTMLLTKSGKEWEKIQKFLHATDAHDILDNIS